MNKFEDPGMFWFLLIPFAFYFLLPKVTGLHGDAIRMPFIDDVRNIKHSIKGDYHLILEKSLLFSVKFVYLFVLWTLLIIAAARPVHVGEPHRLKTENRDIMLVIDISTSMLQLDFYLSGKRVDRLSAVKSVVKDFIKNRSEDRMGLVLFATRAYLQSPLTFDKQAIMDILSNTDAGMAGNSTSIGDALGTALKNLKNEKDKQNKVIILLTDGEQNDGALSMSEAIDLAQKEGIRIYTIGVGADESFFGGLIRFAKSGLDEASLKEIANKTKGAYFRAKDFSSLTQVYQNINKLEPQSNKGNIIQDKEELFYIPLALALVLSMFLLFIPRSYLK